MSQVILGEISFSYNLAAQQVVVLSDGQIIGWVNMESLERLMEEVSQ